MRFLSPSPEAPAARSPLATAAAKSGARFEDRAGWRVPVGFADAGSETTACRETVGWADMSHLRKLEVQGPPAEIGVAARRGDGWWCPLTTRRALAIGDVGEIDGAVRIVDVTASYGALAIKGPRARETFARFCALDLRDEHLEVGGYLPGSVARTPGLVLRQTEDTFLMLFGAAYGDYVWDVVTDAGRRLGGAPVGVDVITEVASRA